MELLNRGSERAVKLVRKAGWDRRDAYRLSGFCILYEEGGRQMDALFIDEGFGTLSDDVLDKALDVLGQLTEGRRLVGIISHVDRLDESIPQKIRVRHGKNGSSLALELS